MRRNGLCVVKTIILVFIAATIGLMVSSWFSNPLVDNQHRQKNVPAERRKPHQQQQEHNWNPIENEIKDFDEKHANQNIPSDKWKQGSSAKKDWHNHAYMEEQMKREGLGEQGNEAQVPKEDEAKRSELFSQNGFNGLLSDRISLNRSIPDIRNEGCRTKQYLKKLPTVSIIIPFYNEHLSTLLRSCYSVLNRSPSEILKEIILVDDFSSKEFLGEKLQDYVDKNLPKVKIVRLKERSGLILARLAGAKVAKAQVLIFLDSHIEANYNWLPPLLEPIAENPKTCVCPFIDVIDHNTFAYRAQDEGARGSFDWEFYYKRLALLPEDLKDLTKPFKSPVMAGGLFAIGADFFWELGGYDEGLDIWGGEQYELSFKIWMCGGEMVDAPCSRVGHIYRGSVPFRNPRQKDYLHKNYKRVAEVWMDEYAQYLYMRNPDTYNGTDAGDISKQKALRKKLKCKSFKWFMTEVAFDLTKKYPPIEPDDYAHGTIQSVANPTLCVDTLSRSRHSEVGLYPCANNKVNPQRNQNWALSWHKDIRIKGRTDCLDVSSYDKDAPVMLWECHGQQGNQRWTYNPETKFVLHGTNNRCLEADTAHRKLYINTCDSLNKNMQWEFGFVNRSALVNINEDFPDEEDK